MKFRLQEEVELLKSPPLVISMTNNNKKDSSQVLAWLVAAESSKIEGWKQVKGASKMMLYDGTDS